MPDSTKADVEIDAVAGLNTLLKSISSPTPVESSRASRSRNKCENCGLERDAGGAGHLDPFSGIDRPTGTRPLVGASVRASGS